MTYTLEGTMTMANVFSKGLLGLRGEGRGVEGSKVKLTENRLILD